jgi:hypothetical protein
MATALQGQCDMCPSLLNAEVLQLVVDIACSCCLLFACSYLLTFAEALGSAEPRDTCTAALCSPAATA